ncbi:MAG: DUF2284 domain-containing protein [Clostridia bacterium]|nr:DUF2284 domain-containing protein [Clostridia bacterium]
MEITTEIKTLATEAGFGASGYVLIDNLKFHQSVRDICAGNTCRNYGSSWACPPAIGTVAECMARVKQYGKMLLLSQAFEIEDSFDFDGMIEGMHEFKKTMDRFHLKINSILSDYLLLSNEGCGRCAVCTYPNEPCRSPQLLHHSLEGYGFIVSELAKEAGIRYNNGNNTVTYFGALLFNA